MQVKVEVVNRGKTSIHLNELYFNWAITDSTLFPKMPKTRCVDCGATMNVLLGPNKSYTQVYPLKVPANQPLSQPYWLRERGTIGMYKLPETFGAPASQFMGFKAQQQETVSMQDIIGQPENPPAAYIYAELPLGMYPQFKIPVQYKHTDPVLGELYQPLAVVPPVLVNLPPARSYVFADAQPKTVPVTLRAGRAGVSGRLALALPAGWKCEPATADFALAAKDEELTVNFQVQPLPSARRKNRPRSNPTAATSALPSSWSMTPWTTAETASGSANRRATISARARSRCR